MQFNIITIYNSKSRCNFIEYESQFRDVVDIVGRYLYWAHWYRSRSLMYLINSRLDEHHFCIKH